MINSHHVNSQTALLSGADAVVLRTFEAKLHFVDLSVFHGRTHGRQWSTLASSISSPSSPDPCADWNSVWNIMPVWLCKYALECVDKRFSLSGIDSLMRSFEL